MQVCVIEDTFINGNLGALLARTFLNKNGSIIGGYRPTNF